MGALSSSSPIRTRRESQVNDFDSVAPFYDRLATLVFGGAIRRAQLSLLPELSGARSVLIMGGGTGWFLLALLQRTDAGRVVYVEKSRAMLARSRSLIAGEAPEHLSRVVFRLGDAPSLTDGPFDAIVTNFFLDLFNDHNCRAVAHSLARHLAQRGRWLFVDFHSPRAGLIRRLLAPALFTPMFRFFNVVSRMESHRPPDYARAFQGLGLELRTCRPFFSGLIEAQLLALPPPGSECVERG